MNISEDWINSKAPNSKAVVLGKQLSEINSFKGELYKTEDETLFWGNCYGSGKKPYKTSIDFSDSENAVCRCSCPSRQFPCKHCVGLMFEMLANKNFEVAQIPDDIEKKREKAISKKAKKEESEQKPEKKKASSNAAKIKKIKKQLEGLEKAQTFLNDIVEHGIGTLINSSKKTYESLAKEFASCYLTGLQTAFLRIAVQIDEKDYDEIIKNLIYINATIQKSKKYLTEKLENKNTELDDNQLYETLGGVWKLSELEQLGLVKENVSLVQLSFDVVYDNARKEYIDRGYWTDIENGKIYRTINYRPLKAMKYVKADDTVFDVVSVSKLYFYPQVGVERVRWENFESKPLTTDILQKIKTNLNADIASTVKLVKNEIKNTLSEKYMAVSIKYKELFVCEDKIILFDENGQKILLKDRIEDGEDHFSVANLQNLMLKDIEKNQIMFGHMFYDKTDNRICLHPYSIITDKQIIRLQY